MSAQLRWLQHRLAAAVGRAQELVPLFARPSGEERVRLGSESEIEGAFAPAVSRHRRAEALPELRLERSQRVRSAALAAIDPVAGAPAIQHVFWRAAQSQLAE